MRRNLSMLKTPSLPDQTELALTVIRLMGQWRRIAQGHIPLDGYSCACSLSFGGITMIDVERDIVDYLQEKHQGVQGLDCLFGRDDEEPQSELNLACVLRRLTDKTVPFEGAFKLLADLEKSLAGLANLHTIGPASI